MTKFNKKYSTIFQRLVKLLKKSNLSYLLSKNRADQILEKSDCNRVVQLSVDNMIQMHGTNYPDSKLQKKYTLALEAIFPERSDDCIIKKMITNRLRNVRHNIAKNNKIGGLPAQRSRDQLNDDRYVRDERSSDESDESGSDQTTAKSEIDVEDFIRTETIRCLRGDDDVISVLNSSGG